MNRLDHVLPVVMELDPVPDVMQVLSAVASEPDVILLESRIDREEVSRYSFLVTDPVETLCLDRVAFGDDPLARPRAWLEDWSAERVAGLPPFQGGVVGVLGYELGAAWERMPSARHDEFQVPSLLAGFYDVVVAWDHVLGRAWIISQGFPETDSVQRARRARDRAGEWLVRLNAADDGPPDLANARWGRGRGQKPAPEPDPPAGETVEGGGLAPTYEVDGPLDLLSDFSRDGYLAAVTRVIDLIHAGDIFQANLSQRLLVRQEASALELYRRLRRCNPAPFAGFLSHDDWAIVSASPERFVSLRDGRVETRPIKGTRRRPGDPDMGVLVQGELSESEKDIAENVMIVDLLRNDLSRVCRPGSVRVPLLCGVEVYETVVHLVSQIRGVLCEGRDAFDLIKAVFPGGSITGAPKVRAMEVIAELEPTARGPYCGSLFYVGCDGSMDSSILIRTFVVRGGWVQCSVGGGIVAQSEPLAEFNETLDKAAGMLLALADDDTTGLAVGGTDGRSA